MPTKVVEEDRGSSFFLLEFPVQPQRSDGLSIVLTLSIFVNLSLTGDFHKRSYLVACMVTVVCESLDGFR